MRMRKKAELVEEALRHHRTFHRHRIELQAERRVRSPCSMGRDVAEAAVDASSNVGGRWEEPAFPQEQSY